MKKRGNGSKKKVFNSVNIVLIALLFVELVFLVDIETTGNPVRTSLENDMQNEAGTTSTSCVSSPEICDGKDNDCDGLINEGEVCEIRGAEFNGYFLELVDESVSKIYVEEKNKVEKGLSTNQILKEKTNAQRKNLVDKQNVLEANIKSLYPKAKVDTKTQNVFNGFVVFGISETEAKKFELLPEVKKVYKNYKVYATLMDSVPLINADDVWQMQDSQGRQITGQGIKIAIIDTGVDYTHPDLGGCFGAGCKVFGGWDFFNNDADPKDDHGHGTHVAATAAGNGILKGVAPDAEVYAYKVLDAGGGGYASGIIAAIERTTDPNQDGDFSDHLDIISMSLGGYGDSNDPLSQSIDNSVNLGVVAVIAAGNSGPEGNSNCRHSEDNYGVYYSICSPGTARKAITIGATSKSDSIAGFSSGGPTVTGIFKPDVTAPGVDICAAKTNNAPAIGPSCLDSQHMSISGTSMATPHVSGAVALIKQAHPDWTPEQIKSALRRGGINTGNGDTLGWGFGRIDILTAVQFTDPKIPVLYPFYNSVFGEIDIGGSIGTQIFSQYTLDYTRTNAPTNNWINIMSSSTTPANDMLYENWDISSLQKGLYVLRLTITETNGNTWSDATPFIVDNTPKVQLKYGFTYPPTAETDELEASSGQTIYFKTIATAAGSPQGVCNNCVYQWYKDDVLLSESGLEYSTSFDNVLTPTHKIKVVVTDNNGISTEKTVGIIIGIKQITTDSNHQWMPDIHGNKIVWSDNRNGNYEIYMYDLSTNTERRITTSPGDKFDPEIYEDKIVWHDSRNYLNGVNCNYDIYMYDLSTNTERRITTDIDAQMFPAIYGTKIVWMDYRNGAFGHTSCDGNYGHGQADVYMYDLSTNTERRITPNRAKGLWYAPDIYENRITWLWWDDYYGLYIKMFDLSTNTETEVTPLGSYFPMPQTPSIYKDKIIWVDQRGGTSPWIYGIYSYDISSNTITRVMPSIYEQNHLKTYGNKIVWDGDDDIFMYDLSTNTKTQLTTSSAWQNRPEIYGNKIVWADIRNGGDIYMLDVSPPTCSDGTGYGSCSKTKPLYCENGNLINHCEKCRCPLKTQICQASGKCTFAIPST